MFVADVLRENKNACFTNSGSTEAYCKREGKPISAPSHTPLPSSPPHHFFMPHQPNPTQLVLLKLILKHPLTRFHLSSFPPHTLSLLPSPIHSRHKPSRPIPSDATPPLALKSYFNQSTEMFHARHTLFYVSSKVTLIQNPKGLRLAPQRLSLGGQAPGLEA